MIILAIDSTMSGCSACLYDDVKGKILSKTLEMTRGQAEHLMPLIDSIISDYSSIDLIAVTKGPGAFTGMRIGLATAKTLGLVLDIPVIGISTFNAILETYLSLSEHKTYPYYAVLLETKRSDYYFQMFEGKTNNTCSDAIVGSTQDIKNIIKNKECIILGDANQRFNNETDTTSLGSYHDILIPSPTAIAILAIDQYRSNEVIDCNPNYLRLPEIGVPKNKPRILK